MAPQLVQTTPSPKPIIERTQLEKHIIRLFNDARALRPNTFLLKLEVALEDDGTDEPKLSVMYRANGIGGDEWFGESEEALAQDLMEDF